MNKLEKLNMVESRGDPCGKRWVHRSIGEQMVDL